MKIKFTHDFRGKLTREQFFDAGTEIEIDDEVGAELIALLHAIEVQPEKAAPKRASKPKEVKAEKAEIIEAKTDGKST